MQFSVRFVAVEHRLHKPERREMLLGAPLRNVRLGAARQEASSGVPKFIAQNLSFSILENYKD